MLTAANRTTKRTQEVLTTSNGEVLTFPAVAKAQALSDSGAISGPVYFLGMVVITGADSAQMTITSDGSAIFAFKTSGAGNADGLVLSFPIYCPNGITCTKQFGASPTFVIYYIEG